MDTMEAPPAADGMDVAVKITRLVEERGWNQEDFARHAGLNRHTIRLIVKSDGARKLRNATVSQCAAALGLHVNELRTLPLDRLLPRMHGRPLSEEEGGLRMLIEQAVNPELRQWLERNTERAASITPEEAEELLRMEETGGQIALLGVESCIELLERRRRLLRRVAIIARTDEIGFLEHFVNMLYDRTQPQRV